MKTEEKGITLVALVVTIIMLLILLSIVADAGMSSFYTARFQQFKSELKTLQVKVDELNEDNITDIGRELTSNQKEFIDANTSNPVTEIIYSGITSDEEKTIIKNGFRYLTPQDVEEELGEKIANRKYLINIEYRYVICYTGVNYNGETYYMTQQLEDGLYNVQYRNKNE